MKSDMSDSRTFESLVRGGRYNIRTWGDDNKPPLLMLHGSRDSSVTFQFIVDHLRGDRCIFAPDFRGHGLSDRTDALWLHDLVADVNTLCAQLFGARSVPVVGHSMGGNVASMLAALRPGRVEKLISLDGFGPRPDQVPVDVFGLLSGFMDLTEKRNHRAVRRFDTTDEMAERLLRRNARLSADQAKWLVENSAVQNDDGSFGWPFDSNILRSLPALRTVDEWGPFWSAIQCPVLWLVSDDPAHPGSVPGEIDRRAAFVRDLTLHRFLNTSHNLHHEEPEEIATLIDRFLEGSDD